MLLSIWLERLIDPEMVEIIKKQFNQNTNQIKFDELIIIFVFEIINAVAMIMIFLFELMYFFLNYYFHQVLIKLFINNLINKIPYVVVAVKCILNAFNEML